MTRPAPTNSASSTSPPATRTAAPCSTWCTRTAEACFMPLTVGGGVRTVEDIRTLLLAGADKVSINTAAVHDPEFVRRGGGEIRQPMHRRRDRRQEGVGAGEADRWEIFTHGGRHADRHRRRRLSPRRSCELGAGEILLTSMDRDGTKAGYDLALTRADRRRRAGAGHRLRRRRQARPSGRRHARRAMPARCSPPRSSISAHTRSREAKERHGRRRAAVRWTACD